MDRVERVIRDYRMSISKTAPKVIRSQIRVVREDGLRSFPLSKQTENEFDGDAHAPNDRFVTNTLGVHWYASKKCLVDHGFRFTFERTFCSSGHCHGWRFGAPWR